MQISIEIDDAKAEQFIAFLKTLNYVQITGGELDELPAWQEDIIDKRLSSYESDPGNLKDFETVLAELKKRL